MRNTKTKKMILNAILLGIGLIVNQIFPAIGAGITPDLTLIMLFCIMVINRDDYKACLVAGIVTGIFTALTTKFPMGQVPNFVDKVVTVNVMFVVMKAMYMSPTIKKLGQRGSQIVIAVMSLVGTLISGFTFLSVALLMAGLPGSMMSLFMAVVLPTAAINLVAGLVMFNIISVALKRTSYRIV